MKSEIPSKEQLAVWRPKFEAWISAPPFERDLDRFPEDETKWAWPGQYRDMTVEVAWEAWQEATIRAEERTGDKPEVEGSR